MATASTNTVIDHSSDAGFQAWVSEFIWLLGTGGALVQSSNAGTQINDPANNRVFEIKVTDGGSGYTSAPTVVIDAPSGGGTQAVATANVSGGIVTSVTVTTQGTLYATAPSVSFTGGGGSGAAATAVIYPVITAARPAAGTNAGYVVFNFADSLQASAPYFFRFDFGTANGASSAPRIQITVGTGVNSSGVIQGQVLAATSFTRAAAPTNVATPVNSFACGHGGLFNLAWKIAGITPGYALLSMYRIRDHSGSQTDEGLSLVISDGGVSSTAVKYCFRRSPAATFGPSQAACLVALGITSSVTSGGDRQCFRHFSVLPELRPDLELVTVVAAEGGSAGTLFPARPTGGADRTYIVLGTAVTRGGLVAGAAASDQTYSVCMLYD